MEKTKYKWTPQAIFLAERAKLTKEDIKECEQYSEDVLFVVGGTNVHDWLNAKFKKPTSQTQPIQLPEDIAKDLSDAIKKSIPQNIGFLSKLLNFFNGGKQ